MSLRRLAPFALALGALACQPSLPKNSNPDYVDYAVFDPPLAIPTPNDLVLANAAQVPGVQGELLRSFATNGCAAGRTFPACGGWPAETPISIGFLRAALSGGTSAPDLDVSPQKFIWCPAAACNATLLELPPTAGALPAPVDPARIKATYEAGASGGTLTIRNWDPAASTYRPWNAGSRYVVALRAGDKGLKTVGGGTIQPRPTMWLLLQDKDLSDPANQSLLPGATPAEKAATGAQLETIRRVYALPQAGSPLSIFGLVDSQFPHREIAVLASFNIVNGTWVVVDQDSGVVPLPIDLLLNPSTGRILDTPGLCGGKFDPGTNPPSCGLSRGIASLDGFSTTAMVFAPTSGAIRANTVAVTDPTKQSVFLFKVNYGTGVATQLYDLVGATVFSKPPSYVAQPGPITVDTTNPPNSCSFPFGNQCASQLIGLQPAAPGAPVPLPPLDEASDYAVVITSRVLDAAGRPIVRGGAAQILLLTNPLVDSSGKSQVSGMKDEQAQLLEAERQKVAVILAQLPAGITRADVGMAYTFHTQSIASVANQLGAAPYAQSGGAPVFPDAPVAVSTFTTTADAAKKYGVPSIALTGVGSVKEATIVTFDKLDPASGAFYSNPSQGNTSQIPALVAIPAGAPPWPLVVFRHGLGRGRADMLTMAASLAGAGNMVVAAIDAAKHGDRSWCATDADCNVAQGWTCNHQFGTAQGDAAPGPGLCAGGTAGPPYAYNPVLSACTTGSGCWDGTGGIAKASARFLIALNLFRTRDTGRQDNLDESMLVRVLTSANGQTALGLTPGNIDATKVYYVGQSLGALNGTMTVATNPRISKAVLNVGGGTAVDILTFPGGVFLPQIEALLGFTHTSPQFFQFVQIAKWVLDPSDPINFASHLVTSPLPNLLPPFGTQASKKILGQLALCDDVVPNPTNVLLAGNIGLSPLDTTALTGTSVTFQWFATTTSNPTCPANAVPHGFLLSSVNAQTDVVTFLTAASPSLSTPRLP